MRWWSIGVVVVVVAWMVLGVVGEASKDIEDDGTAVARPYRILVLGPISSKSHKNFYSGIVNALADRGNQVTMVSPFRPSKPRANVREVVLENISIHDYIPNLFTSKNTGPMALLFNAPELCVKSLASQPLQALLQEEFDLVMVSVFFSTCLLYVPYHLKVPFVYVSPAGSMGMSDDWMGNPYFTSFIGFPLFEYKHPMTFAQRAATTIGDSLSVAVYNNYVLPRMDAKCRAEGLCPAEMPSLAELQYKSSLLLMNNIRTLDNPARPHMPNVISAGGLHCHPSKPLPKELEEWVEGAGEDGFIFFSLGSAVKPSDMPEEYRRVFVNVFGSLKQRVLWKWDQDNMSDLPPNVRLGKWLPQQDILGHPSLRLFITHGGLFSTIESTYFGIPILGLPVMGDQQTNMLEVKREGWGQVLSWSELSEESLAQAISEVMNSKQMVVEAKRRSSVMRDQVQDAGEVAAYWTEYVIRHKGAPHLRSPVLDMAWYQVYNVDVWVTVVAVLLVSTYLSLRLLFACCSCLYSFRKKQKKE